MIIKLAASMASLSRFSKLLQKTTPEHLVPELKRTLGSNHFGAAGDMIRENIPGKTRGRISNVIEKHVLPMQPNGLAQQQQLKQVSDLNSHMMQSSWKR